MDKNRLELMGWFFIFNFNGITRYQKGDIKKDDGRGAIMDIDNKSKLVKISTTDKGFNINGANISVKFNGFCNDVCTLSFVSKLIRIKEMDK